MLCNIPLTNNNYRDGEERKKNIINILAENSTAKTYIGKVVLVDWLVSCCRQV